MVRLTFIFLLLIFFKTEAQTSVLNVADSLYAHGNYSKAIEQYKTYNNQPEVYYKIAKAYIALGNYDAALLNYELAIKASPDNALLKYDYGKLLYRTKKYQSASDVFNGLVYLDYKNPNYHYELGLVLEKLKDSTAQNRFYNAYQLDKTHQKAIFKIAKFHLIKRHYDVVDRYVNKGLESYANNKELISLKAQNYYWKEDYINSAVWFEKLLELGESTQFIHEKLSFCYAEDYNYKKAIEHIEIALKFDPKDATNLYILGQLYQRINDFVNAEKFIKASLLLQDVPLDAEYSKLGTIYNQQKKYKEAIDTFTKALKENPNNPMVQFFLVRSKDEYYKDYDSKIKLYVDFKKRYPKNPLIGFADKRLKELKEEKFLKEDVKDALKEN